MSRDPSPASDCAEGPGPRAADPSGPQRGRACPPRYRHGARAIADAPERSARTLYVIGGLYGNLPALEAVEAMARTETGGSTLCFNGDFNWFNVDDERFAAINHRVLRHDATLGNVEAELFPETDDGGCGCAYPAAVGAGTVDRSNRIHARLKTTAARHPDLLPRLAGLPMVARYRAGDCHVDQAIAEAGATSRGPMGQRRFRTIGHTPSHASG